MVISHPPTPADRNAWARTPFANAQDHRALRVSQFDRVSAFLTALMLMVASVVTVLLLIWLISSPDSEDHAPVPPRVIAGTSIRSDSDSDFLIPESNETIDLIQPAPKDSIVAIIVATSSIAASESISANAAGSTESLGQASSDGDLRVDGVPGDSDEVPRYKRWQLQFNAFDLPAYAAQLDHFQIELGAVGDSNVGYLSQLTSTKPKYSSRPTSNQKRLYFAWMRPNPLEQFDRELFQAAGAGITGQKIVKYIPASLEDRLAQIELKYAQTHGHDSVTEIAKTVFESKSVGGGFEFEITSQRYRKPKK